MRHWLLFVVILLAWVSATPMLTLPWQGLALVALALVLWTVRPLPELHSALLIPVLAFVQGMLPVADLVQIGTSPVIAIFIFGFAFASLSRRQGLDTITLTAISHFAKGSERRASYLLFALTAAISMWTSNAVTTALMLPLAMMLGQDKPVQQQYFFAIAVAFSATIGGMATQVGSSASFIASNLAGIDFIGWMVMAIPVSTVVWLVAIGMLERHFKPSFGNNLTLPKQPLSASQWQSLILVLATVGLFILASMIWRGSSRWYGLIPVFGVLLMLQQQLISPRQLAAAIKYRVLLLFVSAITLGKVLEHSGGGELLVDGLMPFLQSMSLPMQLALLMLVISVLTELMSNVACAALMAPLLSMVLLPQGGANEQVALLVGIGCSLAFVLPTATPTNSLMVGVSSLPAKALFQAGVKIKLVTMVLLWGLISSL